MVLVCILCFFIQPVVWAGGPDAYPDLFSHGNVTVQQDERIGDLVVLQGDAVIHGQVMQRVIVVNGNVITAPGARVEGLLMILGGNLRLAPGSDVTKLAVVLSQPQPLDQWVWVLWAILGCSVLLLGLLVPWMARRSRSASACQWVGERILPFRRRYPWVYLLLGLGVSALMLSLFIEVAIETLLRNDMEILDGIVIWFVRYFAGPGLDSAAIFITNLGSSYFYGIFVPVVLCVLAFFHRWREALSLVICLSGAAILNLGLKHLFERARPEAFRVVEETGYSFPSGHAMVALCFYGIILYLVSRVVASWSLRIGLFYVGIFLAAAIGISRIYLGVHYPSDVIAGYLGGSTWLVFCIVMLEWLEKKRVES
ncbi:phosphatase PAP2 family protein [Acetonema longum]|uniref:Phosphoesterase PA-phosphatase-like protein n=1 Tax=Acetonema longum DSM 6540 TaxID=1009370 RepID=F7NLW4_9FIRM|nr:phosphatase PAP2 family protein [Acetonema longum]EGO62974.1 phosphoesterase PA-phosphatase-like protein [Acetonema longum DSM 6540]